MTPHGRLFGDLFGPRVKIPNFKSLRARLVSAVHVCSTSAGSTRAASGARMHGGRSRGVLVSAFLCVTSHPCHAGFSDVSSARVWCHVLEARAVFSHARRECCKEVFCYSVAISVT